MINRQNLDRLVGRIKWGEDTLALVIFSAMSILPVIETIARLFGTNILPASQAIVQHCTLWIGFLGAVLAARRNKLLALTREPIFNQEGSLHLGRWIAKTMSFFIIISLAWGSFYLLKIEYKFPFEIAPNIPRWAAMVIMPVGFTLMAVQIYFKSYMQHIHRVTLIISGIIFAIISVTETVQEVVPVVWIGLGLILIALIYGAPIFTGLGGAAVLLFWNDFTSISAIPAEAYRIVVAPTLPTIPLFTLAGYLLAESNASTRLVNVFRSLFGWIPGGTPVIVVLLCGFFTALTGGSGVTILALGGLLLPLLVKEGYSKKFALGLITVSGSIGLLLPPSLPAIIYGVRAGISVKNVFIAGLMPGTLLIVMISTWAFIQGRHQKVKIHDFDPKKALKVCLETSWELVIPVLILLGVFAGYTNLVETAAIIVLYVFIIEFFVYKDITLNQLPSIIIDCATLIGGVLIIIGIAMGLTSYLVDAQIPMQLLAWVKAAISSKYFFLLLLNIFLLVAGCLMDIFSAIIVIVPLIKPLGAHFGVEPFHLAIIFIANMELGFLTPPVGMNLFLAAYRFNEDMPRIYRSIFPFFIVKLVAVALITYIPILTLGLLN